MFSFENYKDNIDVQDKSDVKNVVVSKKVICHRYDILNAAKKLLETKHHDQPLAAAVLGLNNTAAPADPYIFKNPELSNTWTDIDEQNLFLETKPTCYLILSKPGSNSYELGEAFSKKFNCLHICPRNVILDELEQESPTGKCVDFNLRHNMVLQIDNILAIIKRKLQSPAVIHRGYVLSGLPLVTSNKGHNCVFRKLSGEESVLVAQETVDEILQGLKKKKPKKQKHGSSVSLGNDGEELVEEEHEEEEEEHEPEEGEEEEEQAVELPKYILDLCEDIIVTEKLHLDTRRAVLIRQINELFNLNLKADIIIYLTSPDVDMLTKKNHVYVNYKTSLINEEPFATTNIKDTLRWPSRYKIEDYPHPYDDSQSFEPKYNCKQPINFTANSTQQMCNYQNHVLPYVEKKMHDFNPKYIFKIDGRTSVNEMMYQLSERLLYIPLIKQVLIPKPLLLDEAPEDIDEFWKLIEESTVIQNGVVNFKRCSSPWFNRCPVELKKRRSFRGKPKFAVSFFKHVYLLSSLDALISFYLNPRPFLKLYYLEPICRIIVIGTPSSGKTMISECLSWIFDAPIISYNAIVEKEKKNKYDNYSKRILSEIIATIEDGRYEKWLSVEEDRKSRLEEWHIQAMNNLVKYVPLIEEYDKQQALAQSGDEADEENKEPDTTLLENLHDLRSMLSFLPFLDDAELCKNALNNRDLLQYGPKNLTVEIMKPPTPVLGDDDVNKAISDYISANDLQKELELTPEEVMNEVIKKIITIDKDIQAATNLEVMYGKYVIDGLTSDPEYWEYLIINKLLPDNTVCLIENREITPEIIHYYIQVEKCKKNYKERFLWANDSLINVRFQSKKGDKRSFLRKSNDYDIPEDNTNSDVDLNVDIEVEKIALYNQTIDKLREDWDSIKLKLEENYKSYIEVELENKTDIQIVEEVLLKLRNSYCRPCEPYEDEEPDDQDEEDESPKDMLTYNDSRFLSETNVYCPIAYFEHGVLWEGKKEFCLKYHDKLHYFSKEEFPEQFKKDVTKYQFFNKPYKKIPPFRICVIGCIGSGKSTVAKHIAKELCLMYIDFAEVINDYLMPRHFKKVGRKYENIFTDVPIDEEAVVEFQMDEENLNLISDMLSNESELRRMVNNYFERGSPILSVLMQKLLKKLWFDEPFLSTGFVIDGFPRIPSDIEDMVTTLCIPDIILEIESSSDIALERISPALFKVWKMQQNEAKNLAKQKFDIAQKEWMDFITKTIVVRLICEDILSKVVVSDELEKVVSTESAIVDANPSGSTNVDSKLFTMYNEMLEEYPPPVVQSEWEKNDEAKERIDARIEGIYEIDDENIQTLKDIALEQKIKTISIDGTKTLSKVVRVTLSKLSNLRRRCESLFEQTFVVTNDVADRLISEGFCFHSKFSRACPVYVFENPHSIQHPYIIAKRDKTLFTIVHRCYVYYVSGEEATKKFRYNPLKYITSNNILSFHATPLRIGIIGEPKSGKSTLAAKLAKRYGLMCISRGKAVRYILEHQEWTELAKLMLKAIQQGQIVDASLVARAVQVVMIDYRVMTGGFVFDGFPQYSSVTTELYNMGLLPLLIINLSCKIETTLERSQNEIYYDIIKNKPPYPASFLAYRYTIWKERHNTLVNHINNDYQNLCDIDGEQSKWQCLQNSINRIDELIPKINYYITHVKTNIVPVSSMCISNKTFKERWSNFKNFCPLCLRNNVVRHNFQPIDKKGLVQYHDNFYWICEEHMDTALRYPDRYLMGHKMDLPDIPAVVKTFNMQLIYESGICLVTYAENLPNQILIPGVYKYVTNYKGRRYLLCSASCFKKFLEKPHLYWDIEVFKETKIFPKVNLNKLPNIGYLEQTVGNMITNACCALNVFRPKYPGLNIDISGLLYMAVYMKIHNTRLDKVVAKRFEKVMKVYEARCKLLRSVGLTLRSRDNPFAKYPKCCKKVLESDSGTVCKPSSIDTKSFERETESSFPLYDSNVEYYV